MKRLIVVIVVIAAAVLILGLSMGWFHFSSRSVDGKSDITLTVDKDKIQQDKDKAVATVHDLGEQARDRTTATTRSQE